MHAVKGEGAVDAEQGVVGLKFELRERGWLGWTCIIPGRVMRLMLGFVMMLLRNWGKEGCRIAVAISRRVDDWRCSPWLCPSSGERRLFEGVVVNGDG